MNIEIANRLVRLRKEKNLSQEALANELGISRQAVSKWERAEASPDTDNLILLAKLYGMSLDDLLKTDQKEFESGNNQQASKEKTEEDKKQKKKESVHISLKHGIHVTGEDGEEVHVGWNGIHVEDPKEDSRIHIDGSGVFVDDKKYDQEEWRKIRKEKGWDYYYEDYTKFPFALLAIIAYIGIALYTELWHPLWIFLLIVPITEGAISAVKHRNLNRFPYPVLVILYFLYEGFYENIWSPTWLIFLTIPVYYSLVNYFRQRKQHKNNNCTDNQED